MTDVRRFVERTTDYQARFYREAVLDMFTAYVVSDRILMSDARDRMTEAVLDAMRFGELVGASSALAAVNRANFAADGTNPILPRVTFQEAVEDFVTRQPVTIRRAAERTAQRIAELYSAERVAAFVASAEQSVTQVAQSFIARSLREGIAEGEAGKRLSMSVEQVRKAGRPWSEGYSRMAFRTNVNTAVSAGRFRQAQAPEVRAVAPAFRFTSAGDADTRDNHDDLDGVILRVDNPEWRRIAPPLGYNCRCTVDIVTVPQLERMGRIRNGEVVESRVPSAGGPDAQFRHGGRPDLMGIFG